MKFFLILILFLSSKSSYGQLFQGYLTYTSKIEISKKLEKTGITQEQLITRLKREGTFADTITVSYRQENYCVMRNTNPKSWSIYLGDSNKIYSMQEGELSDICYVTDASIDLEFQLTGNKPIVKELDTSVTVNDHKCHVVRVKWKAGTYDYYYDTSILKVDPVLFLKHEYDGWAEYLQLAKSLPIQIVMTTNGIMTNTMTLLYSKELVIDQKLFRIPNVVLDERLNILRLPNKVAMRIRN